MTFCSTGYPARRAGALASSWWTRYWDRSIAAARHSGGHDA